MTAARPPCRPELSGPTDWELRVDGPLSGTENMRRDEEALAAMGEGACPRVRVYRWSEPTLSYGRLQSPAAADALAQARGVALVQRPTGGGMVLHEEDISFSVAWDRGGVLPPCIRIVYQLFHQALAEELRALGVQATLYTPTAAGPRRRGLCYEDFCEHDVVWGKKKLIGGALRITKRGRLYQGNLKIPLHFSTSAAEALILHAFDYQIFGRSSI